MVKVPQKKATKKSLASRFPKERTRYNFILASAFILFVIGIFAPILTFKKFLIFSSKVSIISGLAQLLSEGHHILFALILIFSIVFPLVKLVLLFRLWNGRVRNGSGYEKLMRWMAQYGKWSMLDVFVAALLIVTVKLGAVAHVKVHYGLYAFAASVILTMLATSKIQSIMRS
jgi:paraquat-inducible protein A